VNLESFRCSAQEQEGVRPETILAAKASVQVVTHNLSCLFESLVHSGQTINPETNGVPTASIARQSSASGGSSDGVTTATNVTLRLQNSARIISLANRRPSTADDSSGQCVRHKERMPDQPPRSSRDNHTLSSMPADWQSPFSLPDPLAFDNTRACTILTDPRVHPTIPKIVVNACSTADDNMHTPIEMANENLPLEFSPLVSEDCSTDCSKRRDSGDPAPPLNARQERKVEGEVRASPGCTMYVPYRPWYEPINKVDTRLDLHSVQETSDRKHEIDATAKQAATASSGFNTKPQTERLNPSMPLRSPPPPPVLPIVRSRHKPRVPPRRRAYCVVGSTPLTKQECPKRVSSHTAAPLNTRIGAHMKQDSTPGLVKLPYLDELKRVLDGKPLPQRRASTGEFRLDADSNVLASVGSNRISRAQSMETFSGPQALEREKRKSRSASAPELTTPQRTVPLFPVVSELSADPPVAPVEHRNTAPTSNDEGHQPAQFSESYDPSLMLTRMNHICGSWNSRNWSLAESYLTCHLSMVKHDHEIARRVRHLLGVCASYWGQWQRALVFFIGVVNTPVRELDQLDCGDKAAFHWLGDTYALLNRNEETILAYCLAGSYNIEASTSPLPRFTPCLLLNQEKLRQTVSKTSFKGIWADPSFYNGHAVKDGILHCTIVSQAVAQECLSSAVLAADRCSLHGVAYSHLVQGRNDRSVHDSLLIAPSHLELTSAWPLPYDPTFNLQSVAHGSLIAKPNDIINELLRNPENLHFSRWFAPNLSGPHCMDLRHLVTAVRESLQTLAMRWHEVVSLTGVFFLVQYDSVEGHVATMNYFRIEITRFPLRNGFGLNFCSESTGNARKTSPHLKRELKRCLRAAIVRASSPESKPSRAISLPLPRYRVTPPSIPSRGSTESSTVTPAELETPPTSTQSTVDISTLVPPIVSMARPAASSDTQLPLRARARISVRSLYNERNLLGSLVR
jgi:hypothetical protein